MAAKSSTTGMKKTLGLTGITVNAMALIAPGAFLWMTYQLQAANVDATGTSTALDMWTGIVAALVVAFLTAFAFAELARRYPEAGSGSAYYFAEKAFLDREKTASSPLGALGQVHYRLGSALVLLGLSRHHGGVLCRTGHLSRQSVRFQHAHLAANRRGLGVFNPGRLHRYARYFRFYHGFHRH